MVQFSEDLLLKVNTDFSGFSDEIKKAITGPLSKAKSDFSGLGNEIKKTTTLGKQFSETLTKGLVGAAFSGRKLSDSMRSLALSLSKIALKAATKPINEAFGSLFGSVLGSVSGSAKGSTQPSGLTAAFARGGILNSPVGFPLGRGRLGVAGEAGPEAILPLARGPDGRLGVQSGGGAQPVTINFNVTSPDAAGFLRSEAQIATMLNRVVSRGQRNL